MKKKNMPYLVVLLIVLCSSIITSQTTDEWRHDIDILTNKIEQYHPMPWAAISKEKFMTKADELKSNLSEWNKEKIIVEIMKLTALLEDGHTEVLLNYQESLNLWFPLRIEYFFDGIFITAADSINKELVGAEVLKLGKYDADSAYRLVGKTVARDSKHGIYRLTTNYLPNAIILKNLGIIDDEKQLELEVILQNGNKTKVTVNSAKWGMWNNWSWYKTNVPTSNKTVSIFDDKPDSLPLYLSKIIPSRIPYWFEYLKDDRMIYFQFNTVTNWKDDPFGDFTKRLFQTFEENSAGIENFVIDLRFNEGGNGYLLPPFVREFIKREKLFKSTNIYIITGTHTFSAAPNFIGRMLNNTNAVTVGDIAAGPLNWCSDVLDLILPYSQLRVNISTMYWQEGHATDNRGYYPPDYYMPATFKDYFACKDHVLEAIKNDEVLSFKDVLLNEGADKFLEELSKKEKLYGDMKKWFPYTSFEIMLFAYFNLIPAEKFDDVVKILKFNTTLYPDDNRSWYALAEILKEIGLTKEALQAFEKLISMEPNTYEVNNDYRDLLLFDTYNTYGIKALSDLINNKKIENPHFITENTLTGLGYKMMNNDRIEDAIKIFELNVKLHPKYSNGYNNLGEAYMKSGNNKLAIQNYEKSLELDTGNENAKKMLKQLRKK
ncbi:MAG: tetratricopeptide repeat protein [Ignavibacteria bacterium]|jgi:tetratricopeptide (TPR) repeat protein